MTNAGDEDGLLRMVVPAGGSEGWYQILFEGCSMSGSAGLLYVVDEYNHVLGEATLDSRTLLKLPETEERALLVKVFPRSEIMVTHVAISQVEDDDPLGSFCERELSGFAAVVVPTYPTPQNTYPCAFVHARVKAYREARVLCDVLCAFDYEGYCAYEFEGVRVLRMPLDDLPALLKRRDYRAILLHFFDLRYAKALDEANVRETPVFLWSHNPETLYWDWPRFTSPYFRDPPRLTEAQKDEFRERDAVLRRYNDLCNVSWVFVSEPLKRRSEELLGFRFNRAHVIPNLVDEKVFPYREKDVELRNRVFFVRKFDNIAHYAVDIDVATIVELSKRPCFAKMEFTIYGTGDLYDKLVEPLNGFENVHLIKRYLSREEMACEHDRHGVALYATRFDSQGVTMCEAAMSGLAVVSSQIDVAAYFLPDDQGLLCEVEDPVAYADVLERLCEEPEYFAACARSCHRKVARMCGRRQTVDREIELIKEACGSMLLPRVRTALKRWKRRLV